MLGFRSLLEKMGGSLRDCMGFFARQQVQKGWVGTGQSGTKCRQKATRRAGSARERLCGQQDRVEVDIGTDLSPSLAVLGLGLIVRMEHRAIRMLVEQTAQEGYEVKARSSKSSCSVGDFGLLVLHQVSPKAIYYSQGPSSGLCVQSHKVPMGDAAADCLF